MAKALECVECEDLDCCPLGDECPVAWLVAAMERNGVI